MLKRRYRHAWVVPQWICLGLSMYLPTPLSYVFSAGVFLCALAYTYATFHGADR